MAAEWVVGDFPQSHLPQSCNNTVLIRASKVFVLLSYWCVPNERDINIQVDARQKWKEITNKN
jgi:hypothetical protein